MTKCAFYGTLRKPMYNYVKLTNLFGLPSMRYKSTVSIPCFEMYLIHTAYPGVKESSKDKRITVDLFDVNYGAYDYIKTMEENAGYFEDEIKVGDETYKIFPYALKTHESQLILSGDWLKFINIQTDLNIIKSKNDNNAY